MKGGEGDLSSTGGGVGEDAFVDENLWLKLDDLDLAESEGLDLRSQQSRYC